MKIILAVTLLIILCLASMIHVSAAPVLLYLDTLPDGKVEKEGIGAGENDVTFMIASGGTMFGKFKVGAEYGIGKIEETGGDTDASLSSVKAGYRLLDLRATKLDGVVATIMIDTETASGTKNDLDSIDVGFDFTQYFSKKLFLAASVVYSADASYDYSSGKDDDASVSLYRAKLNYLINDNWGAALGYTDLNYDFKSQHGKTDVSLSGWHLGALYKF